MQPFLILGLFLVVALTIVGLSWWAEQKRNEWWMQYAQRLGWNAWDYDALGLLDRLHGFALLSRGHSRKILRLMSGESRGRTFCVFDYRFVTGSGKNRQTHNHTVLTSELPFSSPGLIIRPEHFGDWLAGLLGFDDIDFEYDEFNRAFHVSGPNKKFAYDLCSPSVIEFLLVGRGYAWEFQGRHALMYSPSSGRLEAAQIESALAVFDGLLDRLPRHLESGDRR